MQVKRLMWVVEVVVIVRGGEERGRRLKGTSQLAAFKEHDGAVCGCVNTHSFSGRKRGGTKGDELNAYVCAVSTVLRLQ